MSKKRVVFAETIMWIPKKRHSCVCPVYSTWQVRVRNKYQVMYLKQHGKRSQLTLTCSLGTKRWSLWTVATSFSSTTPFWKKSVPTGGGHWCKIVNGSPACSLSVGKVSKIGKHRSFFPEKNTGDRKPHAITYGIFALFLLRPTRVDCGWDEV